MSATAGELLAELDARGIRVRVVHGGNLSIGPSDAVDEELLSRLREYKSALLIELAQQPSSTCPKLPEGVRLVRYAPKRPPVAIDFCSVVVEIEKFIQSELRELNARLHSPVQIRGGWGVFQILDRLRQVGLELEIVNKKRQE